MSLVSVTDIVIIAATIGGLLILVGSAAIFLLLRRHKWNQKTSSYEIEASLGKGGHWHTNGASRRRRDLRPPHFPQLQRKPTTQSPVRTSHLTRLFRGLLPSGHHSVLPSEWAVRNGGHVPRPHLLRKSRGTIGRDSWLSAGRMGVDLARSTLPSTSAFSHGINDDTKQTQTVKARMAHISGPPGGTHIVSMIVDPEHDARFTGTPDLAIRASRAKTNIFKAHTSWQSQPRPYNFEEALGYGSSPVNTPGSWSYSLPRARRSMSLPYIPSSRPPSSAIPPVPTPSYLPHLLVAKRVVNATGSPSKRSFASRTTTSSSIFDSISPSLRKDLRQISTRAGRSESRRAMRRHSSVPGLREQQFVFDETPKTIETLGRRPSGASSQLLPSPARPVVCKLSPRLKKAGISKPRTTRSSGISKRTSPEGFRVRTRDMPVSLIGLQPGWNVFGHDGQILNTEAQDRYSAKESIQQNLAHVSSVQQDEQSGVLPDPKAKVLQKKWTKQEEYTPLSFAAVAYSSAVSLDTPVQVPGFDHPASSVYSIPPAPIQKDVNKASQTRFPEPRLTNDQFRLGNNSPDRIVELEADDQIRNGSPRSKQELFGPRQMPMDTLQTFTRASACDRRDTNNQPEQASSTEKLQEYRVDPAAQQYSIGIIPCKAAIDPPPVRLNPTPLRRSFYSYEAIPNVVSVPNRPASFGNTATAQSLPIPARTVAAPRPPSSLSNNFRASALYQSTSRRSSAAESRLSGRGSTLLTNSQSFGLAQAPSRPISTGLISPVDENGYNRISRTSSNMESGRISSTSATPLKNYSDMCNLFPKPLSIKSRSRPPTWVLPKKSEESEDLPSVKLPGAHSRTSTISVSFSHPSRPGLPPYPRFFIEQELSRASNSHNLQTQHEAFKNNTFNTAAQAGASIERPPSRRGSSKIMASSTQMMPPITDLHSESESASASMPIASQAPQSSKISTTSNNHQTDHDTPSHKHTNNKSQTRTSILGPISVNIGTPTSFTANQGQFMVSNRYRETAPSPSSQGSTSQVFKPKIEFINLSPSSYIRANEGQGNIHGTIGQERQQKTNANTLMQKESSNAQLRQRIRQRKAQAHIRPPPNTVSDSISRNIQPQGHQNPSIVTGLGITIPVQSYFSCSEGDGKQTRAIRPDKRKAESNTVDMQITSALSRDGDKVNMGIKRQRSSTSMAVKQNTQQLDGIENQKHSSSLREWPCRDQIPPPQGEPTSCTSSPGRIWREEVF